MLDEVKKKKKHTLVQEGKKGGTKRKKHTTASRLPKIMLTTIYWQYKMPRENRVNRLHNIIPIPSG